MIKAACLLAASAAALGLATLSAAQDNPDEEYWSVTAGGGPWFFQRSTCTPVHNASDQATNENDHAILVIWFRIGMGSEIEFADRRLRGIRDQEVVPLAATVDGARQDVYRGVGLSFPDGRQGYRFDGPYELLDAIAAGRRLEVRRGGRPVLQLDLAGAGPAIAMLRACHAEAAEGAPEESDTANAM